jgi:uncharacterized protein YdeI (YjbR/CyaY-like superfamily)
MAKKDPRIDTYITKAQPFARPILTHIRRTVHAAVPAVEETVKWGMPHFDYKGILCSMAAFKGHCALGFWKARLLADSGLPARSAEAMGQFGRITSVDDLPPDRVLVSLVKKAAALNDAGVKVARGPAAAKQPLDIPAVLLAALKKNARARKTFEALPPSHKREYAEWIAEAKTAATRDRRLATTLEWLGEGKSRNWKYESR